MDTVIFFWRLARMQKYNYCYRDVDSLASLSANFADSLVQSIQRQHESLLTKQALGLLFHLIIS
jgi:hypothetical protein